MAIQPKVIGIGLNKTATKSLAQCLEAIGYRNQSYCLRAFIFYQQDEWQELFSIMDDYTSFEDWPWPLMYKEIEQHYPDAKFILTTRATPDQWYESLCKMAVRMGPLKDFEKHIYGYSMPQGRREEHINFYNAHNAEVRHYFSDKPGKLIEICFDKGVDMAIICELLDKPICYFKPPHANKSAKVYAGDSLWLAHVCRVTYQSIWYTKRWIRKIKKRLITALN